MPAKPNSAAGRVRDDKGRFVAGTSSSPTTAGTGSSVPCVGRPSVDDSGVTDLFRAETSVLTPTRIGSRSATIDPLSQDSSSDSSGATYLSGDESGDVDPASGTPRVSAQRGSSGSPDSLSTRDRGDALPVVVLDLPEEDDMARPQLKFHEPPKFWGRPDEDALDWLTRYETIGHYNRWAAEDLRTHFIMSLDGAALKWYRCADLPVTWDDVPAQRGANAGDDVEAALGLRSFFLREFQQENYAFFQEKKLRARVQGPEEPVTAYYYDVMDLCRIVDPQMPEAVKLENLFRGINPKLLKKVYPMKPRSCSEFLSAVKLHSEASEMVGQRTLGVGMVGDTGRGRALDNPPLSPTPQSQEDLVKLVLELKAEVGRLRDGKGRRKPARDGQPSRTADGKIICYNCRQPGHIARVCTFKPNAADRKAKGEAAGNQTPSRPGTPSALPAQLVTFPDELPSHGSGAHPAAKPILRIDLSRMVMEEVLCGSLPVKAMIDTGAAVSVISPGLVNTLALPVVPWEGPCIAMANGQPGVPSGAVDLLITHPKGQARGKALVMDMGGVALLLGNDFLSQFRRLMVDYTSAGPTLTLGELPVNAVVIPEQTTENKLVTKEGCLVPAYAIVPVTVRDVRGRVGEFMVNPSANLFKAKNLSTGHALISDTNTVFVANLSSRPSHLTKGTVLGKLDEIVSVMEPPAGRPEEETQTEESHDPLTEDKFLAQVGKDISERDRGRVARFLMGFKDYFARHGNELGKCNTTMHGIDTGDAKPIHQLPYKSAWRERTLIQDQVETMLKNGVIEPSESPWSSPVVLVKKKDGNWRFCVDYRKLNNVTVKDVYPLPRIEDALNRLQGARFFSIMDLQWGYHQIGLKPEARAKSAFVTADGLYQFKVLPFGLTNAPSTFQRAMDLILAGLRWNVCLVYIDDVVVYSNTLEEHFDRLRKVLECIGGAGLKLKLSKCHFAELELKVLGHVVSKDGIAADPDKLRAVAEFPSPESTSPTTRLKLIQSFLGLCSYYRKHIPNFAMIARPLTELSKKDVPFVWGPTQNNSFLALKEALTNAAVLAYPDYDEPMEIFSDACGYGIGAVLSQRTQESERPLAYASRLLSKPELNYTITEKECLALIWALKKFRSYIWGCKIKIITDHQALCWLRSKTDLAGRLARWSLSLQEFDFVVVYRSGKLHDNADCLSRYPVDVAPNEDEEDDRLIVASLQLATPDSVVDMIRREQRKVPSWSPIIEALENGKPSGNFLLEGGLLYINSYVGGKMFRRVCIPPVGRRRVCQMFHDDIMAGHLGVTKTIAKIIPRFYWPGMRTYIYHYVRACPGCQARKNRPGKPTGLLQCIKVERPFEKVGIDILGPFPKSKTGNRNIIVAVDYLTKWVETRAIPTGKAPDVADFFVEQVFLRHGAPETITTDRGKVFISELTTAVTKLLQTTHKTTTSYNPQANGQVERMNHVLADMISMYVGNTHRDWDEFLPFVTFAYNTAKQETTGYTPFYLLYGREAVTPSDLEYMAESNFTTSLKDVNRPYVDRLLDHLSEARSFLQGRVERAKEKQKSSYDANRQDLKFVPGDLVLVYKPIRKKGLAEKLLHRWLGPYTVIRETTPVNYEVKLKAGRGKTDIVHVARMKPFREFLDTDIPVEPLGETSTPEVVPTGGEGIAKKQAGKRKKPTVTEAPTPVLLPAPTSSRPQRARRAPIRYPLLVVFPFLLLLNVVVGVPPIIAKGGTLFKEVASVAFTESSWTIVSPLSPDSALPVADELRTWLTQQIALAKTPSDRPKFNHRLMHHIVSRAGSFLKELHHVDDRIRTTLNILNRPDTPRPKRGILDGGGTALKWLFGVATESDFERLNHQLGNLSVRQKEVVHLLEHQASVVNESLSESRKNTLMVKELADRYTRAGKMISKLSSTVADNAALEEIRLELMMQIEETFDAIVVTLNWLIQYADDLEVGMATLAGQRLPPQFFPPYLLEKVLETIVRNLPKGWALATTLHPGSALWSVYRSAKVSVAETASGLMMFIRIPVFEQLHRFTLYRIFSLPEPTSMGQRGIIYANLPNYLAASADRDTYIELSTDEAASCVSTNVPFCHFHAPIGRRLVKSSCSLAIFLNDAEKEAKLCKRRFVDWRGTEAVYLGQRRWAVSSVSPQDVVITCPSDDSSHTLRVPRIGIFEIPPTCSARTAEWIFPGSTNGRSDARRRSILPSSTPPLLVISSNQTTALHPHPIVELDPLNTTNFDKIDKLLMQNAMAINQNEISQKEIGQLLEKSDAYEYTHYPFEWILVFAPVCVLLFFSFQRLATIQTRVVALEDRMTAHEAVTQTAPPETTRDASP